MSKINVAVLRGGPSTEYEVSLRSGKYVHDNLPSKYNGIDVFIDRKGVWHRDGMPRSARQILEYVDVVFNALHGEYGEDGKVQAELQNHGKKYTGSKSLASAIAMNKDRTKKVLQDHHIRMPRHIFLTGPMPSIETLVEIFRIMTLPFIIKPNSAGSSFGVSVVNGFHEFEDAVMHALSVSPSILIEEFIRGREATCGVLEEFRGEKYYTLPPVEIIPHKSGFFDYDAKYNGKSHEICPGNFSSAESNEIRSAAVGVHKALGLSHYSRSDFIVTRKGVYFLEANTLPGLTEASLLPMSLGAIGCNIPDFLDHVITLAMR